MSNTIERLNAALEGRYQVEREIGEGGMATVFLARDLKHNRGVALKLLKPELAAVVGAERFLAEIETTANLQHPHILPLFDSGEADGFLFYVMPFVEGETLRDRLDRERQLPIDDAVRIATNVAEALDYAHRQGVIHRDIKPANILLQDGKPVISDFGIALAVGAAGQGRLTETGLSVGTPHYMSPEQAMGETHVGPATDLYALGCVLYEMLVGTPPFTGGSAQAVLGMIISTEAPSARLQRKTVPVHIDAVVRKSLEKLPADRFPGAERFAKAMATPGFRHAEIEESGSGVRPRTAVALAGAAGALGLIIGWALIGGGSPAQVEFGDVRKVSFDPGIELMPAISPDGQEVAYVAEASASEPSRVLVQSLSGGQPTRVSDEGADGEAYPQWTADGASLSFHAGGVAYQVGARGGTPRPIMQVESGTRTYGAWSPDGTRFAYVGGGSGETGMYVRENEVETKIADIGGTANSLAWSPDGRWIAYAEGNADWTRLGFFFGNVSPSAVMVVAADGGTPVEVAPSQYLNVAPAFLPDGRLLFVSARGGVRDVYLVELTPDGAPAGEPRRITAGLNPHSISVSADGRRLAFGTLNRRRNLYSVEIPTSGVVSAYSGTPVVDGPQVIEGMAVSPDGQWLAFDSDRGGTQTAYRRRLSGGEALQLTTSLSDEFVRSWSPDGSFIAGHGFNEGVRDIWVSDPDGLSFRFVLSSPYQDRYPDISPDGRRIAFGSERDDDGTSTLFVSEVDSQGQWGPPTPIGKGAQPRWSPDGTTIASSFQGEVFLTSPEGGESRIVPVDNAGGFVAGVEWVTDQELVVMLLFSDRTAGIWSLSRADGSLRERVRFDDPARTPRSEMAVHDGKVYYTFGEFEADIWLMEMTWR